MANLTTILGTDSLSSSRIVINDNFSLLNTELSDISDALNTSAGTLTLTGNITGATLTVASGFVVSSSQITMSLDTVFEKAIVLENGLQHSFSGLITTAPTSYEYTTYLFDASVLSGTLALAAGNDGQEITILADEELEIDVTNIYSATAVTVGAGGAITLRYLNSTYGWAIISATPNCTVTY